ncbi:MAG: type IV pilus modification PilV family protein [Candidatus Binatia bacterium]
MSTIWFKVQRLDAGFTLIEILIAMAILNIAILAIAAGATSVIKANQTSYFNTIATNLAQDKLEELKANSATMASGGPDTTPVDAVTFTRNWTVTPDTPVGGLSQIDVTVTWTDYAARTLTVSSAVKP